MKHLWLTLAVAAIVGTTPARAEDVIPPRFEIGGNVSGILPIVFEDGPVVVAGGGPRVTMNVTPRFRVELLAEVLGLLESSGTTALYQTQLKLPVSRSRDGERTVSFTVGAAGTVYYRRTRETRIVRLDGSTVVYPGFQRLQASVPNTLSFGVARDQVFGRYASSSLALQGYIGCLGGIALRASVGVSFGVGGYR
jgi:hypothetical protein